MKKKLFFTLIFVLSLLLGLAIIANAENIYKDTQGNELFRYELVNSIITNETGIGFAKEDENGDALIWYVTSTATDESSNTVYTVESIKTAEATTVSDGKLSLNTSVVSKSKIVSINFDIGNYTTIAGRIFYDSSNVIYAYIPSYVTTIEERLFRGASKLIKVDIPYDSKLTDMGLFFVWGAKNLREFFVPKNVLELNNGKGASDDGTNNYSTEPYFNNCVSLKKVIYHPDNVATVIKHAPLYGAKYVEEVRFGNNLKFLGDRTFRECNNLKTIYFGDSFEGFYSNYMFYRCNSLENLYLPATVGTNTTGLTYRWYYVFKDAVGDFKVHYTGTQEQFLAFYNMVIGAGGNEQFASAVTDGVINTERVVFTTDCEAFYYGEHKCENDGNCTTALICERCNRTLEEAYEEHNNQLIVEYADGYMSAGYKKDGCTRCSMFTEEKLSALFKCQGYSSQENGNGGIAVGFTVNSEAIKVYTNATGKTLKYGVFAVSQEKLDGGEIFDSTGVANANAICVEIKKVDFAAFDIKVTGFTTENESKKLAIGAYVAVTDGNTTVYSYIQDDSKGELSGKYYVASYKDIVGA
ncbi:MAG: leucine-rich repeat protein [Clostridia bacterium]|nr:leucine-rich repeat protein [Clostridia bacterium]